VGKIAAGTFSGLVGCLVAPFVAVFVVLVLLSMLGMCA
jgi:hypothetical protein